MKEATARRQEIANAVQLRDEGFVDQQKAAELLGIDRSTLYAKLRRYGLLDVEHAGQGNGKAKSSKAEQPESGF